MARENKTPLLYTSFLYVCGLILFLEWLYPVKELADINQLEVFIIYTIFCFLLSLMQLRWWMAVPLKLAGIVFIIHLLYIDVPFMSQAWFEWLYSETAYNFQAMYSQSWYSLTSLFRTILFLLIIWIMSYLTHYWFYVMKRFFLFILLTFIYVAVIDTFTLYDGNMAIIRVFVVSFIALGVAHFLKEMSKESIGFGWMKRAPVWIVPIIMIVLFSSVIGFAAPKYEPQWPDPVPFIKSVVNPAHDADDQDVIRKVGYGEDDSMLGGSFIQDDSVVFRALTSKDHYWRIETKDVYTGKGWEQLDETNYIEQTADQISLADFPDDVVTEQLKTFVTFERDSLLDRLVYPYMPTSVEEIGNTQLLLDQSTEAIHTRTDGKKSYLTSYGITYEYPVYNLDALQSIESASEKTDIYKQYTQLPDSVPDRVYDLAEDITEPHDNMHDKALAVERHFQQEDYVYQIDDVPIPEDDEDYVDQFLFDTQAGYCDNYSTSMVVLLRTIGIPTRWAKGFTSGTKVDNDAEISNAEEADLYEITNSNAHSWVEVYFDDIGWVPFEPTKGFSSNIEYSADGGDDDEIDEDEEDTDDIEDPEKDEPDIPRPDDGSTSPDNESSALSSAWWNGAYMIIGSFLVLGVIAVIIYKTRHQWRTTIISRNMKRKEDVESFESAYQYLLRLLHERGIGKQPDQTLREYAKQVDEWFMTEEMRVLTNHYEKLLYNNEHTKKIDDELLGVWNDFIKQVLA